jgi:CBS domain-containing protein
MAGWSFSIGKVFGVEVRLHSFFLMLLFLSMGWSAILGRPMLRGVALWLLVLLALAVRELARGMAAAWFAIDVKSLLMLPTGGIQGYASPEAVARAGEPAVQKWMALTGPLANTIFAATVAGVVLTVSPQVNLWEIRWVTPEHLLRAMVWVNLLLAAVNLLPAWPLDAGRVVRGEIVRGGGGNVIGGLRAFTRIGPAIATALIVFGMVMANWWLIMCGIGILLGAQIERQGLLMQADSDIVKVADVMLTEYSILSASATLEDAIEQASHTLQDVFPVVRGGNMVGAVARQNILEALESTGNGYVQGIMTRTFQTAAPQDSLIATLNRVTSVAGVSSQLVPVVDGDRIVGIITPQNLQRSMGLLTRRTAQAAARSGSRDGDETD